jgi:hypothetical protein
VEAVFNTLLEEESLLGRLFSLLDQPPPLACKAAGYFGRVLGQLLLRKTNEMMQYLSHNEAILGKLMTHVDTTSIADIVKRLVGADDHSSMIFSPMHTQWLAETPLIAMLLERLGAEFPPPVQVRVPVVERCRALEVGHCPGGVRWWVHAHVHTPAMLQRRRLTGWLLLCRTHCRPTPRTS